MSISVIIADDHTVVREGLRLLLETQDDIRVVGEATNGRDAVKEVRNLQPDIIILDIAMPELNGISAAQQIHKEFPKTKIIILSMHSATEHIFRSLKAGAKGYLLKESAGIEVVNAVRAVFKGNRYLSHKISESILDDYMTQKEDRDRGDPFSKLSPREMEVLQLVVEGKSSSEIAKKVFLSAKTVETYRSRLMQKLGVNDIPGLVKLAIKHKIIELE